MSNAQTNNPSKLERTYDKRLVDHSYNLIIRPTALNVKNKADTKMLDKPAVRTSAWLMKEVETDTICEEDTAWPAQVEQCAENNNDSDQDQYEEALPEETDWDDRAEYREACGNSHVEYDIEVTISDEELDQQEEIALNNQEKVYTVQILDSDQQQSKQRALDSNHVDVWQIVNDSSEHDWDDTIDQKLYNTVDNWNDAAVSNEEDSSVTLEVEIVEEGASQQTFLDVTIRKKPDSDAFYSDSDEDVRPFACDECSKRYMQKSSLSKHKMLIHRKRKAHFRFPPKNVT